MARLRMSGSSTLTSVTESNSPITTVAMAIKPKSCGVRSRARMIVLTRPIDRMVQRMPTIHAAPCVMLCLRLLKLGWSLGAINGPHRAHGRGAGEERLVADTRVVHVAVFRWPRIRDYENRTPA